MCPESSLYCNGGERERGESEDRARNSYRKDKRISVCTEMQARVKGRDRWDKGLSGETMRSLKGKN